jgi:hypothetical protein
MRGELVHSWLPALELGSLGWTGDEMTRYGDETAMMKLVQAHRTETKIAKTSAFGNSFS